LLFVTVSGFLVLVPRRFDCSKGTTYHAVCTCGVSHPNLASWLSTLLIAKGDVGMCSSMRARIMCGGGVNGVDKGRAGGVECETFVVIATSKQSKVGTIQYIG